MKKFILGFVIGAVIFGAAGAFAVSYLATPAAFKVFVNGSEFNSDPPALVVEGRTYLPLRAIGDALGVPVKWNEELSQAEVGTMPGKPDITDIKFYPENPNVPDFGYLFGQTVGDHKVLGTIAFYYYPYDSSLSSLDQDVAAYIGLLQENGFVLHEKMDDQNTEVYTNAAKRCIIHIRKNTSAQSDKIWPLIINVNVIK